MKVTDAIKAWFGAWVGDDPAPPCSPPPPDRYVLATYTDGEWHVYTYDRASVVQAAEALKDAPLSQVLRANLLWRLSQGV